MRSLWAFLALSLIATPLHAAPVGGPMLRDGVEIIPGILTGLEMDHVAPSMSKAPDTVFLSADVHAGKDEAHGFAEHVFIPYLSISFSLTRDDAPTFKRAGLLLPVAAKDGPHYAAAVAMDGPGTYHLTYIVAPPSSHGMLRQTGKDGVPDWWKPITANWIFTYPASPK